VALVLMVLNSRTLPATVLVEDHGFRRAAFAAMVPGCCMAM
jgi:hypothetical protein